MDLIRQYFFKTDTLKELYWAGFCLEHENCVLKTFLSNRYPFVRLHINKKKISDLFTVVTTADKNQIHNIHQTHLT